MNNYFEYHSQQFLPVPSAEAWAFFSSPANLADITPGDLGFTILSDVEGKEIYDGMLIDYIVRPLFGIPVRWTTEIFNVHKPFRFSDRQLKGPYEIWEHEHRFEACMNGVMMTDHVKYKLPLGMTGRIVHSLLVRKRVEQIFDYRKKTIIKIFNDGMVV